MTLQEVEEDAWQTGRSFSKFGEIPRMGFFSKKLTGFNEKLDDTVGIIGKSS